MTTIFIIDRLLQPDVSLPPLGRLSCAPAKKSPPPARFASNAGPVRSTRTGPRNRCDFSDTRCRRHFTNFRSRQHTGIDIDIFGEAAPKMRHFFKSEVAAVIDRRLTAVGMLGKMSATIAFAAVSIRRRPHGGHSDRSQRLSNVGSSLYILMSSIRLSMPKSVNAKTPSSPTP